MSVVSAIRDNGLPFFVFDHNKVTEIPNEQAQQVIESLQREYNQKIFSTLQLKGNVYAPMECRIARLKYQVPLAKNKAFTRMFIRRMLMCPMDEMHGPVIVYVLPHGQDRTNLLERFLLESNKVQVECGHAMTDLLDMQRAHPSVECKMGVIGSSVLHDSTEIESLLETGNFFFFFFFWREFPHFIHSQRTPKANVCAEIVVLRMEKS